jgi:inner membrane transporter RhtA
VIFALWRQPWRRLDYFKAGHVQHIVLLGVVLAVMNLTFYYAIARLPLSTVGAIEFLGPILLAAYGLRTPRNIIALSLTALGVIALTQVRVSNEPVGFAFAFANCAAFILYIMLGHRIANARACSDDSGAKGSNIDQLAAAMLIAAVVITPFGLAGAVPAFATPSLLAAAISVGICSSVIPYVTDQLAMARLPRATFSLMLSLLPVFATIIGALVLRQFPTRQDAAGIFLVAVGVALHQQEQS